MKSTPTTKQSLINRNKKSKLNKHFDFEHQIHPRHYQRRLNFYKRCKLLDAECDRFSQAISRLNIAENQLTKVSQQLVRECDKTKKERDKLFFQLIAIEKINASEELEVTSRGQYTLAKLRAEAEHLTEQLDIIRKRESIENRTVDSLINEINRQKMSLQHKILYSHKSNESITHRPYLELGEEDDTQILSTDPSGQSKMSVSSSLTDIYRLKQEMLAANNKNVNISNIKIDPLGPSGKRWGSLDPTSSEGSFSAISSDKITYDSNQQVAIYDTYTDLSSFGKQENPGNSDIGLDVDFEDMNPSETEDDEVLEEMTEKFSFSPQQSPQRKLPPEPEPTQKDFEDSLNAGGQQNRKVHFEAEAVFLDAALEGEPEVVMGCLKIGKVDVGVTSGRGMTALHKAALRGSTQVVNILLSQGADVNMTDADGWTPLHCAVSVSNVEMIKHLVKNGASMFTPNEDGDTPIKLAYDECEAIHDTYSGIDVGSIATATECLHYLLSVRNNLGVINGGRVWALYDFEINDENILDFKKGEQMKILKKSDQNEDKWWVAVSEKGIKGLVPGNYLSCYKPNLSIL